MYGRSEELVLQYCKTVCPSVRPWRSLSVVLVNGVVELCVEARCGASFGWKGCRPRSCRGEEEARLR